MRNVDIQSLFSFHEFLKRNELVTFETRIQNNLFSSLPSSYYFVLLDKAQTHLVNKT